jgi:hypothetical protein
VSQQHRRMHDATADGNSSASLPMHDCMQQRGCLHSFRTLTCLQRYGNCSWPSPAQQQQQQQ